MIVFDFRSPEKEVVTSQKTVIDDANMGARQRGWLSTTSWLDPVRAVNYTIRAFDGHEKELRVANPGPYVVE